MQVLEASDGRRKGHQALAHVKDRLSAVAMALSVVVPSTRSCACRRAGRMDLKDETQKCVWGLLGVEGGGSGVAQLRSASTSFTAFASSNPSSSSSSSSSSFSSSSSASCCQ
jgi:hypothetical protein